MENNQPEETKEHELCPTGQFILNKFKRLDRERKDWKKLAKSMFVCLGRLKPKQKKLMEKYLKIKHKYRKPW